MRFAQALQSRFEVADLPTHFADITIDLAGRDSPLADHALQYVVGLSRGKRGIPGVVAWPRHFHPPAENKSVAQSLVQHKRIVNEKKRAGAFRPLACNESPQKRQ
jgi:hypothetical protein